MRGEFEISWQMPKAVELVIWDDAGWEVLVDALEPESYYILKRRNHPVFLHPLIVCETLISALTRRNTHYGIVIKHCHPKTVITLIDNNRWFHRLAVKLPNIRFIAIQNGIRHRVPDEWLPIGPPATYKSEYFCFGQSEIDSYRAIGYQFKKIRAMGSVKNALFSHHLNDSKKGSHVSERGHILLISQHRPTSITSTQHEYEKMVSWLYSYLKSHPGLQASVALSRRSDNPEYEKERLFHQEKFGNRVALIPRGRGWMTNYQSTEQFDVVVASSSTLAFESLARGRKALLCDVRFYDSFLGQSRTPDWMLSRLGEETFDDALTKLLEMPLEDFVSRNRKSINYFMIAPNEDFIAELKRLVVG